MKERERSEKAPLKVRRFRRVSNVLIVCTLVALVAVTMGAGGAGGVLAMNREDVYYSGRTDTSSVAVMINVYWGEEYLPQILQTLQDAGAKATFFIGGSWADDHNGELLSIVRAGHEVGSHGYFHKDGDNLQVNDDIRSMVEFRRYNMLDDITFTDKFEVIFCRNVLRFFTEDNQRKILAKLSLHQPFGGILYLGKNEQIPCIGEFYQKVSGYNCVYESRGLEDAKPKPGIKPEELLHYDEDDDLPSFSRPKGLFGHRPFASEAFKR